MLTAAEARALTPKLDPVSATLSTIENAIRRCAEQGRSNSIEITGLVPQPHSGAWANGQTNEVIEPLASALTEAGYTIDTYEGGQRGRGYIKVSW